MKYCPKPPYWLVFSLCLIDVAEELAVSQWTPLAPAECRVHRGRTVPFGQGAAHSFPRQDNPTFPSISSSIGQGLLKMMKENYPNFYHKLDLYHSPVDDATATGFVISTRGLGNRQARLAWAGLAERLVLTPAATARS